MTCSFEAGLPHDLPGYRNVLSKLIKNAQLRIKCSLVFGGSVSSRHDGLPITGSDSTKEPDILATRLVGSPGSPVLAAEGETLPLPSIVVVEIKRPIRNDAHTASDTRDVGYFGYNEP